MRTTSFFSKIMVARTSVMFKARNNKYTVKASLHVWL